MGDAIIGRLSMISKYWKLRMFAPFILMLLLFSHKAYGYIDPGTTSAIFGILAPLFSMLLVFLAFLIRPFRRFFRFVIDKFIFPKSETDGQLASDGLSHHHEDGEDI